jgi:8-oxo-dGTP pyrophosphatase MutT (NUDIX family)
MPQKMLMLSGTGGHPAPQESENFQPVLTELIIPYAGHYKITDDRDLNNARWVLNLITHNPDAFESSRLEGHVTASAFVICHDASHVLLTHHAKLDCWLQLGGHCDGLRDPAAAALREAQEESGLDDIRPVSRGIFDIDVHQIPEHCGTPAHLHYDIRFLFKADRFADLTLSAESKALAWVPIADLQSITSKPSVLVLKRKLECL